jgi:hypothetical protein
VLCASEQAARAFLAVTRTFVAVAFTVLERCCRRRRGFLPGFLGPWRDEPARDSFDEEWGSATREARWCCATWGSSNDAYSTIGYALPRLFKGEQSVVAAAAGAALASLLFTA